MGGAKLEHGSAADPVARAAHDTHVRRRRRVVRNAVLLLIVTAALLGLMVMNRDAADARACRARMEFAVRELQRLAEGGRPAPVPLPTIQGVSPPEAFHLRDHVDWNVFYAERGAGTAVVGVCVCRRKHDRFLLSDGRYAVVWRPADNRYEIEWIPEADYPARAAALGFIPARR